MNSIASSRFFPIRIMHRTSVHIVVLGGSGSGKSSLVQCFVSDSACTPQSPPPSIIPPRTKTIIWEASCARTALRAQSITLLCHAISRSELPPPFLQHQLQPLHSQPTYASLLPLTIASQGSPAPLTVRVTDTGAATPPAVMEAACASADAFVICFDLSARLLHF